METPQVKRITERAAEMIKTKEYSDMAELAALASLMAVVQAIERDNGPERAINVLKNLFYLGYATAQVVAEDAQKTADAVIQKMTGTG